MYNTVEIIRNWKGFMTFLLNSTVFECAKSGATSYALST